MTTASAVSVPSASSGTNIQDKRYLFGPVIDFLGLGGASLIALLILTAFTNPGDIQADVTFAAILIANVINHPHFAHSYQIFYRDFGRKIGKETPAFLRYRYWFAGIIAPICIAIFYAATLAFGDVSWIGYSINVMLFLVGWHYVKQGYGMLSVDSVLKKKFFTESEKKLLIWNAYATWAFSYIYSNEKIAEYKLFGVEKYAFIFPDYIYNITFAVMAAFFALTAVMFGRRLLLGGKGLPVNGVMAYLVSLYIWTIVSRVNPLFLLVIPAFHSLQYMMVTTRFQLNVETEKAGNGYKAFLSRIISNIPVAGLVQFYLIGAVLGFAAFWAFPFVVTLVSDLETAGYPALWAFAVFWVFINVHHYLLDNVMWRKGNPDVAKHLFAHQ